MASPLYTQEQLEIALLKRESSETSRTLVRIETQLHDIEGAFDMRLDQMDKKIDAHFKWILGVIGTVAFTTITTLVQHWFK